MSSEIKSRKGVCPPLIFSSSERKLAEGKKEEEENKLTLGKLTFRIRGEGERMDSLRGGSGNIWGVMGGRWGGEGLLLHWATLRCIALISVASSRNRGGRGEASFSVRCSVRFATLEKKLSGP